MGSPRVLSETVGVKGRNEEQDNPGEKERNTEDQAALGREPPHLNEVHDQTSVEGEEQTAGDIGRRTRRGERERLHRDPSEKARTHEDPKRIQVDRKPERLPRDTAEESTEIAPGATDPGGAEYWWVIDPLDGTRNYVRGLPFYCVSIALMEMNAMTNPGVGEYAYRYDPESFRRFAESKGGLRVLSLEGGPQRGRSVRFGFPTGLTAADRPNYAGAFFG